MAHYSCGKCLYTTKEPFCPSCNNFLTSDVTVAESIMKPLAAPEAPVQWCTAFGHWGDIFCCVGVMKSLMAMTGQGTVNVLYVGPDLDIVDWLESQSFMGEVIGIKSSKGDFYEKFWYATAQPNSTPYDWWPMLYQQRRDLPLPDQYTQTHINAAWFETRTGLPAQLWHDGVLPDRYLQKARETLMEAIPFRQGPVYHLHPVSTWSEAGHNHWAHWPAAIEWLVEKTPYTYVLTGLEQIPFLPTSPRLINLIGTTNSNMDVLAISAFCNGVISTPNSIALWGVIARQKCLCVGNMATQFLTSYYRRWLQRGEQTVYLNVDTPFSGFQSAACEFLDHD